VAVHQEMRRMNILLTGSLSDRLSEVSRKAGVSKTAFIRQAVEHELQRSRDEELRLKVAEIAPLYHTNEELTVFSSLDGEEFL